MTVLLGMTYYELELWYKAILVGEEYSEKENSFFFFCSNRIDRKKAKYQKNK